MLFLLTNDTALLLEEPETHQHPESLERLAKALCRAAKQNSSQIFLTTHSRECIRRFLDAAVESQLSLVLFHTSLADGLLSTRNVPAESVRALLEVDTDIRFLDLYG